VNRVSLGGPTSHKGRTNRCSKVKHGSSSDQRLLVVILDIDVYDMYRFIELAAAVEQIWSVGLGVTSYISSQGFHTLTIADGIITSLLTSDNDISDLLTLLPSFRCQFDLPIPIKHL